MGKTSAAVKNRYAAKAYDRITALVRKGQKAQIQAHAAAQGKSLNGYIVGLIEADMALTDDATNTQAKNPPT